MEGKDHGGNSSGHSKAMSQKDHDEKGKEDSEGLR